MLTRILAVYSTVLTTVLAAFTFAGAAAARIQHYDEIDVHRLNVREPDGTYCVWATIPRAVLSRTRFYDRIDVIVPHLAGPSATNGGLGVAADELEVSALVPTASTSDDASNDCTRGS